MNAAPATATGRRWGRIAAIALAIVAALIAALYAAVVIAFPPERLAALLADQVTAATGRAFRIGGGLSIRVLPTIAVRAEDITLANLDGGSRPDMVRVRRAAFEVSPEALLRGRIRILRVDVEGVDVLLESDAAGRGNWHFTPRNTAPPASAASTPDTSVPLLKLDRLVFSDGHVAYRDGTKSAARELDVESLDLLAQGEGTQIAAVIASTGQRWKIDGRVGHLGSLLVGSDDWPVDLRIVADGASATLKGTLGTGDNAGQLALDVTGRFASAAVLTPYAAGAAALPMPLELSASVRRSGDELRADPLHLSLAGSPIDGRITLTTGKRPRLEGEVAARELDVEKVLASVAAPQRTAAAAAPQAQLFDSTPLPFAALPELDLRLTFKIERLKLPRLPPLSAVAGRLTTAPGRLALDDVHAVLAGGTVRGRIGVEGSREPAPRVTLSVDAKSLAVPTLQVAAGQGDYFRGGRVDFLANLALAGSTPKSLAASTTGEVLLSTVDVTLPGGTKALDRNVIVTLLQLLIPMQSSAAKALVVDCAVVRLPLRRGVAVVDHSIAFETHEIAVSAAGEVNLGAQTIRLEFKPRVKKGLGLNPANLADLMVLSGPLQDPHVGVDVKGAALGAADVGVAVATAGVSLLVTRAVKSKDASGCREARAGKR